MSSWLNLNESLNTLKGQISNFANNVLAENEEGTESPATNYEDLKSLYVQKEREIENLKKVNEELQKCLRIPGSKNGEENDNNWDWTTPELMVEESISEESVPDLKQLIKELESEKKDLISQLEQLDSENQQNLTELVGIREHLQEENNNLNDECEQLKQQNKVLVSREEKFKKELKDLQQKIEELRNSQPPSTDPGEKYENIIKTNEELDLKLKDTMKELAILQSSHEILEKTFCDTKKNDEEELKELMDKFRKTEMENKIIYGELQRAEEHVKMSEQKIQEDSENCQKLAVILETYERQVSSLKEELSSIKNNTNKDKPSDKKIELLENSNQELKSQLDKTLERVDFLENKPKVDFEEMVSGLNQESANLKRELEEKSKEVAILKQANEIFSIDAQETNRKLEALEQLNIKIKDMSLEKETLHKMYVNIITDNVKRYIDSSLVSSDQYESSEDPRILEFSRQVEDIFKILLDYKQKSELFEKEVLQVSQEKTELLNEKNSEIEKLMQNSEILSQDIINKTETIKELETEITNLMTSNDVLMSELDAYKNSGLQTISESNEDNMLLLETDLDNANKRIGELEKIILSNESSNTSLEAKVAGKLEDYQELLNSYDELKIDYDVVTNELSQKSQIFSQIRAENEEIKTQLEKVKSDFENTDYQLSEANFSIDSLTEEIENIKLKQEELIKENKELKLQNMNSIDLKTELNEIKEMWLTEENLRRELESQLRGFKEKLQSSKMTETTLKVQYDTLNKEHVAAVEAKNNLEQSLSSAKKSIAEYEKNYTELLQNYDCILLRCEELNTNLHDKNTEILKLQNDMKTAEEEKEELEKRLEEKTEQLQQYIHLQDTKTDDLSNISKLQRQVQELEDKISILSNLLKDEKLKTTELENVTEKQAQDMKEITKQEVSSKEALSTLQKQLRLTEEETVNLRSALEESQEENKNLQSLFDKNIKDFAQQTLEQKTDTSVVDQALLIKDSEIELLLKEKVQLQEVVNKLQVELQQSQESICLLQQQLQELANSRNELITMVTTKHQESLNYHTEIQRLSHILKTETEKYMQLEAQLVQASNASQEIARKSEENDKLADENNFLKEKCDVLAKNLLEEQSKLQQALTEKSGPSDKEISLSKQLERLQSHLVELEEHYTQELLQAEQKNAELQTKVTGLEQREKNSSNMYTSVSIRANQQAETLQNQLQLVTNQRDELRKKISDAEDTNNKQAAALTNLQFVLEQFQKDKEKDVIKETERIRRQIHIEKQVQEQLRKEIDNLKEQLEESKIGLQAASRLSDQLEIVKKQNSGLKEEVSHFQQKLAKCQETIHNLTSQTDGKIDKILIKSLVVGLVSSGTAHNWNKDQAQIIKIIATVLDFNQQDHDKVKLNQPQQGSWLGSILFPQPSTQNMSQESLSQAFVRFLENESAPRVVPSLLSEQSNRPNTSTDSSKGTTPRASPIVLNEIVLPTFADFGQSRNSSSILKDVLKDNSS